MLTLPASVRVFVARGATDLRRSFDRLSAQVQEVLRQDPLSGHVFVFFNRPRNRVKLLVWERDGFWLLYKRLEAGTFTALERDEKEIKPGEEADRTADEVLPDGILTPDGISRLLEAGRCWNLADADQDRSR